MGTLSATQPRRRCSIADVTHSSERVPWLSGYEIHLFIIGFWVQVPLPPFTRGCGQRQSGKPPTYSRRLNGWRVCFSCEWSWVQSHRDVDSWRFLRLDTDFYSEHSTETQERDYSRLGRYRQMGKALTY